MAYICPVCGFNELTKDPKRAGSFEICPSCGFQFGVSDDDKHFTFDAWRQKWIEGGMKWSSANPRPANWNPAEQLKNIVG